MLGDERKIGLDADLKTELLAALRQTIAVLDRVEDRIKGEDQEANVA
jgi:hypothetical protein